MTRCIDPVKNNTDKQNTYRTNISRYNKAMKEGFFLEALLIDYALMEDRLRSFLYHIGLLENRDSYSIDSDRAKKSLKPVIEEYKGEKDGYSGAVKPPVRRFGNRQSGKWKPISVRRSHRSGRWEPIYRNGEPPISYSLNAGSMPYTSLIER